MKALYTLFFFLLGFASACVPTNLDYESAAERNERKLDTPEQKEDAAFMVEAADYNLLLKELAQKASEEGYSRLLANFASQSLQDHKTMGERLKSLARNKEIALPGNISDRHQPVLNDMKRANNRNIDRVYLNTIEIMHERLLRLYEEAAVNANDAEIRSYAAAQLDIIRSHNRQAKEIRKELI